MYNEEKRISATLGLVLDYCQAWSGRTGQIFEILVVDDGSVDQSISVVNKFSTGRNLGEAVFRLIKLDKNYGKGYAVRQGMLAAAGAYRLFTDADNSTPITELEKFWPRLAADVLIGSRALAGSRVAVAQAAWRQTLGRLANVLIRALLLPDVKDTQCGFKMFSAKAAVELFSRQQVRRWGFDFEVLAIARRHGFQIVQVPVTWYNSADSRVRPLASAIGTLCELARIRWNLWAGKYD